ncbi:MAG: hypothetical protein IJH13_04105 [Bacilli bacterium]|nr:hypothetical protein [Bacilli bacterium]
MNRKVKLFSLSLFLIVIYYIYINVNPPIEYLDLGDNYKENRTYHYYDYITNYLRKKNKLKNFNNYTSDDYLIEDIYNEISNSSLKKDLREAKILTISIGKNNILYLKGKGKSNKEIKNSIKTNIEELIKEIRKYYKRDIYLLEIENKNTYQDVTNDINRLYRKEAKRIPKLYYIETNNLLEKGPYEKEISKRIIKKLEK